MDLNPTVAAVRAAQTSWAQTPLSVRCEHIQQIGRRFAKEGQRIVDTVCKETRKNPGDAWFADVLPNLDLFDYWTGAGLEAIKSQKAPISKLKFPKKRATLTYEPQGVIGLISPWNYPIAIPLRTLIPALVAGNGVLFKPSEVTPECGALLAEIFNAVLPTGLLQVVQGAGEAGAAVVDASDHVIFTGSVATGRKVALQCAEQLKKVSLELGGKDAAIVLADCDFDRTVQGILWGATSNSGQNCAAVERVYVERSIHDAFVTKLVALAQTVDVAPVATEGQDAIVRGHLADALEHGGKIHGDYPGPVVVTNLPSEAKLLTEETFGPIIPVVAISNAEDGLQQANNSRFGLTTSIWTRNIALGERLASRAASGTVTINNASFTAAMPFAPWYGQGESGSGVTNSHLAILDMVHPKFILVDESTDPEAWWYPLSGQASDLAKTSVEWLSARGLSKLGKTMGVLGAMKRRVAEQKAWFKV